MGKFEELYKELIYEDEEKLRKDAVKQITKSLKNSGIKYDFVENEYHSFFRTRDGEFVYEIEVNSNPVGKGIRFTSIPKTDSARKNKKSIKNEEIKFSDNSYDKKSLNNMIKEYIKLGK